MENKFWRILVNSVLYLGLTAAADAATLYVDNRSTCPGNGASATPFCSIQNAFNVVNPGDNIKIRSGTGVYDQNATLTRSGTSLSPIIIEPDVGASFIVRHTGNGSQAAA